MSDTTAPVYEASVYSRPVTYRNLKGEESTVVLYFALDPLQLLQAIAGFKTRTSKSGNPAQRGKIEIDDGEQVKFVRDLCIRAAGTPSDDGEIWEPFTDFEDTIAGKAFLTKLTSSDGDRREFTEKVLLDPFRAFVTFAAADPSNTAKDIQQFQTMLVQMENIFSPENAPKETVEERRARLQAEMDQLTAGEEATE